MRVLLALVRHGRLLRTVVVVMTEAPHFLQAGWQFVAIDPADDPPPPAS